MTRLRPTRWFRAKDESITPASLEHQANFISNGRMRTTDYRENLVNLVTFYLSYLLLLASAAVIIAFSLQKESSFTQTFDVQPFPSVLYAWNANPSATSLAPVSSTGGGGGQATCQPKFYEEGSYVRYACTSIAADARESLAFYLYSSTPYPTPTSGYRSPSIRYADIEVPKYYIQYYTYIPAATTVTVAGRAASTPAAPLVVARFAAATRAPALQPRQAAGADSSAVSATSSAGSSVSSATGGVTASARTATATAGTPSLLSIQYPSASVSALVAGTIVSRAASPSATSTSITLNTAKLESSYYIFFIVVAGLAVLLATPTFILTNYNLAVARKKVFPPEAPANPPALPQQGFDDKTEKAKPRRAGKPRYGREPRRTAASRRERVVLQQREPQRTHLYELYLGLSRFQPSDREPGLSTIQPTEPEPVYTSTLQQFVHNRALARQRMEQIRSGEQLPSTRAYDAAANDELAQEEVQPPPAYQEREDSQAPAVPGHTIYPPDASQQDAIEEADAIVEADEDSIATDDSDNRVEGVDLDPGVGERAAPVHIHLPWNEPLKERTDGRRLSVRLAWMILPSYAFSFFWDGISLVFVVMIAELTAIGLAGDAMMDVGRFVRMGGCLAGPADKDSVYDLQLQLCPTYLSRPPVTYLNVTPVVTTTRVARDLLLILIASVVLFLANLTWLVASFRKASLASRDGMEPIELPSDCYFTGKTDWNYITVRNKVGSHDLRPVNLRE